MALVAGINRVPSPATGKTAFLIFISTPLDDLILSLFLYLSNKSSVSFKQLPGYSQELV